MDQQAEARSIMKSVKLKPLVSDLCALAGCGLIVYGMYLLHPLAAIFTAGIFLIVIGFFVGLGDGQ